MIEQRRGNMPLAIEAYQNAIARGDRSVATYQRLFQLLVAANRTAEAEQHLLRLKQRGWLTSNLENLEITIAAREGDWDRAVSAARRAVENRPGDPLNHLWLGQLLLDSKQTGEAEAAFRQAVAVNERDVRSWNGLFSFYLRTGKSDLARQTLEELAKKADLTEAQRVFVLAQGYEHLGDTENAETNYERAAELEPKSVAVQIRLANFYVKRDTVRAEDALKKVLELSPNNHEARFALAATLAARGDDASWQHALDLVAEPGAAEAASLNERFELVLLLSRGGEENLLQARQLAEKLVSGPGKPAPVDQLLLIRVLERESALEDSSEARGRILRQAEDHYVALIAENQNDPTYTAGFIDLLRRNNEGAKAEGWLGQLESAWLGSAAPPWDKLSGYADFLIKRGFTKEAVKPLSRLEQILAAESEPDFERSAQLVDLCIRSDELARAAPWLNKLDELEPTSLGALAARVQWLNKSKQSEQAAPLIESFARSVVASEMNNQQKANLVLQLGNLCLHSELHSEAERWYREYIRFQPHAYHTVALAMAKQGDVAKAIRFCEQSSQGDSSTRPAIALAMVLINSQPDDNANRLADPIFAAAMAKHPKDAELLRTVADVWLMQGRLEDAQDLYRTALELEPRSVVLLNNMAALLSEQEGKIEEANNYIDQALSIAGPQAALYDTKGMIRLYSGDARRAAEFFETAAYLAGADPRHHFHLAAAYEALGEVEKAREAFQKSLEHDLSRQLLTETDRSLMAKLSAALQ
jgi:tetratricopeptide (TPR) repeat protein